MEFLILFGLFLLVLLAALVGILYLFWRQGPFGKVISFSLASLVSFFVVTAIWPLDSFYIEEFEYRSNLKLPKSAKILAKRSSYPDFHGDYYSMAIIQLSSIDFSIFKKKLPSMNNKNCQTSKMISDKFESSIYPDKCWSIIKERDGFFNWSIFHDDRVIYFEFFQS